MLPGGKQPSDSQSESDDVVPTDDQVATFQAGEQADLEKEYPDAYHPYGDDSYGKGSKQALGLLRKMGSGKK